MFQHIGSLTLGEHADAAERERLAQAFRDLDGVVPGLLRARAYVDPGLQVTNCSVLFVLDFESEQAWRDYSPHPAHRAIVGDFLSEGRMVAKSFMQLPDGDLL